MKLAEALIERKGVKESIDSLRARLQQNILVQEGDQPAENPGELLEKISQATRRLEHLIGQISRANNETRLDTGETLAETIVKRDMVRLKQATMEQAVQAASPLHHRYSRKEVKFVVTVDVAKMQTEMDQLSKLWRNLDAQIQATNWLTDVDIDGR